MTTVSCVHAITPSLHPTALRSIPPAWVDKIEVTQIDGVPVSGPCWMWRGATNTGGPGCGGYGRADDTAGRTVSTHRFIYEQLVGPVPEGLELDHLCRQRACCAPHHLEPVTHQENVRRGSRASQTHCVPGGHPLSGDNVYVYSDKKTTRRYCRACTAERQRVRRAANRLKRLNKGAV